jgi:signal transduction histidine kinase
MDSSVDCQLASIMAERLREARTELTTRWLERISERVSISPERIFPTEELLDHAPRLIDGVADFIEDPTRAVAADTDVISRAREIGALRHAQGFDEFEILKEYEIFGGIIFAFLGKVASDEEDGCSRSDIATVALRLFQAISLIQQATATQYLQLMRAQLGEREERLRSFNRALTHELRNRMGAISGAAQLLEVPELADSKRRELGNLIVRNATAMRVVLEDLLELSRVSDEARQQRHVRLRSAAAEVRRHLRDAAKSAGVEIRVAPDLPDVEVSAAAVELCLMNLLSNAIKYADSAKERRVAEVGGYLVLSDSDRPSEVVVEVRDNGIGVPASLRGQLFERFFRAHAESVPAVDGSGLGLSIVRETVETLGGRVWADFTEEGSVFAFAIPCRRSSDIASLGDYVSVRRESEERHP